MIGVITLAFSSDPMARWALSDPATYLAVMPELARAFGNIRNDLRSQYIIYYTPTNQNRDSKFREIKVKLDGVDGKYDVRAKRGYEALPTGAGRN